MNEDKFGMDVHQATIVCAVHNPTGKCIAHSIIETKAETVRDLLRGLSNTLCSASDGIGVKRLLA